MSIIGDAFLKAFNPLIVIKVTSLEDKSVANLLNDILFMVKKKYETVLDDKEDVIYLGKKK